MLDLPQHPAALRANDFLSVTKEGNSAIFSTTGNEDVHIILRGGSGGPNYDAVRQQCVYFLNPTR
jgi:3-deoxy-7-phosphoheptulonate synthase